MATEEREEDNFWNDQEPEPDKQLNTVQKDNLQKTNPYNDDTNDQNLDKKAKIWNEDEESEFESQLNNATNSKHIAINAKTSRFESQENINSDNSVDDLGESQNDSDNSNKTINIILAFHSTSQANANEILSFMTERFKHFKIVMLTESVSNRLHVRMNLIKQSDALILITTCSFQRSHNCIELIHFANSIGKKIFAVNFFYSYKPFGALGFLLSAHTQLIQLNIDDANLLRNSLGDLGTIISKSQTDTRGDQWLLEFSDRNITTPIAQFKHADRSSFSVLISCSVETLDVAQIILDSLKQKEVECVVEDSNSGVTSLQKCKLLIVVMSSSYESDLKLRSLIDSARQLNKRYLLVFGEKNWSPVSWLKILVSGRECFRVFSREQANEKNYDHTTEIERLISSASLILYPKANVLDLREYDLTFVLKNNIEKCKAKLRSWPPIKRTKIRQSVEEKSVKIENTAQVSANLELNKKQALRLKSGQSLGLKDIFSIYSNKQYDCTLLYERSVLELVLKVNEELNVRNVKTWLNLSFSQSYDSFTTTYEPIANAIETSKIALVFLNRMFLTSDENKAEFDYAVKRGKAFIFLQVEDGLEVPNWMESYLNESTKYEFFAKSVIVPEAAKSNISMQEQFDLDFEIDHPPKSEIINAPEALGETISEPQPIYDAKKLDTLTKEIRDLGGIQPNYENLNFTTDELVRLKELLDDALDELSVTKNELFKVCTRCNKEFDSGNNNIVECRKHTGFFIQDEKNEDEGRWVCCSQKSKFSLGCSMCGFHTIQSVVWIRDARYGTFTYEIVE